MVVRTLLVWLGAYLLGSAPLGMFWAWIAKRIDVRQHGSGRTGGTNVWRTAGFLPALLTSISDGVKAAIAIWIGRGLGLDSWSLAIPGALAVLGHNHSIYLKFRGGAGTAASVGAAFALWPVSLPILLTIFVGMILLVGHASMGSIAVAITLPILFLLRGEVAFALGFGVPAMLLTLWALRPNILRLFKGEERFLPIYVEKPPLIRLSRHPASPKTSGE